MSQEYQLDNQILEILVKENEIKNSNDLAQQLKISKEEMDKTLISLNSINYVSNKPQEILEWQLSEFGKQCLEKGTPEAQLWGAIPADGISQDQLSQQFGKDFTKFGFANGMKKKFFALDKQTKLVMKKSETIVDEDQQLLKKLSQGENLDKKVLEALKKRDFVVLIKYSYFTVTKGKDFQNKRIQLATEVTSDSIKQDCEIQQLKPYNWNALGKETANGNLHPLQKVKKQFKEVLLEMGFEEMPTNNYVESCFWNFDTLFVPQKHPARDLQDTFYISDPPQAQIEDQEYFEKVKKVHEQGDFGSIGYQYDFQKEESQKLVFRTHTTAATARMLHKIAKESLQEGEFKPRKIYSIDRVFRNEHLDATHLAEFHQIEGIVADKEVGLGHLMGIIEKFFNKIGIKNLTFKPTYNPYTEPSLEIYGYHPILKKMVEIGNSGVFRPEMLRPMGIPEDVQILGWGLGLERPTMIQYGYSNIRELFGDEVDLKMVKKNPLTCFK